METKRTKNHFLYWELVFQIQWLGLSFFILFFLMDLQLEKSIPLSIAVYVSKVFEAAETSYLDWRISKLEEKLNTQQR